ncbi:MULTISPECIES: Crp/Fnr family transcriptional regulator [unclassified Thiocapsa]|uniref:Crp/Fnr family transcriptional regulator n=1 Tax=unclassified Thiocapsa TaxID=2641286 RepID=UPI0035AFAB21
MIEELKTAPLLAGLSTEQLERVSRHAVRVVLGAEQILFSQGDPAERFYLVLAGQIQLYRLSPSGAEKVIELVSPGQTFAEALMFLNAPRYPVCAGALAPTELISLDARDFAQMLRESVETCFLMLGSLSQRLRGLIGEIDNLTMHSASSRVARYLLAKIPPDRRMIKLDVRKGVLASRLSIQPETFSRVVKDLGAQGVIDVHGAQVTILDRDALGEIAQLQDNLELGVLPCGPAGLLNN